MSNKIDYEQEALLYAEKYGIIAYEVSGNIMEYNETLGSSIYNAKVNLDTMKEKRVQVK